MARGRKTGGRKRGTPNVVTRDIREAIRMLYEKHIDDLDRWIAEAGDGFKVQATVKGVPVRDEDGEPVMVVVGKDPAKAAAIMAGLGEHFVPKLQRIEKGIPDASDEELLAEVRRRAAEAEKAGEG